MVNKKESSKGYSMRQKTHKGIDKIMDKAESMGENSMKAFTNIKDKTIKMKESVESYVQDNLKKSMFIAIGLGAVFGAILITKLRRSN